MAEVLSPFKPANDHPTMYRPSSSDTFQNGLSGQHQHQNQSRMVSMPRTQHSSSLSGGSGYRGTATAPVSPYAFKSTPQLRQDSRGTPSPPGQLHSPHQFANRQRPSPSQQPVAATSSPPILPQLDAAAGQQQSFSADDSNLLSNFQIPPIASSESGSFLDSFNASKGQGDSLQKAVPDRYRRGNRKSETNLPSVTPAQAGETTLKQDQEYANGEVQAGPYKPQPVMTRSYADVVNGVNNEQRKVNTAPREQDGKAVAVSSPSEPPKRYRRTNSQSKVDTSKGAAPPSPGSTKSNDTASPGQDYPKNDVRPSSSGSAQRPGSSSNSADGTSQAPRNYASADSVRRINNPSPLSRPMTPSEAPSSPTLQSANPANQKSPLSQSPAVAAMAALNVNDKDANKGVKSRLRRAFSFGSSAELRRAAGEPDAAERARQRREQFSNELDEEQEAIAQKQEAGGLGNSIYSGQGGIFTGSTDNLSISSTASSASLMLRKMGRGVKKGGRSLKGMFRPKSVIGVPPPDEPRVASVGQVSMVTVEAERQNVNVNADPHDQTGGGTGFPRLERNSMETAKVAPIGLMNGDTDLNDSKDTRRSIVGGEHERAEVLAAVRRGILKRSATDSPTSSPIVKPQDSADPNSPLNPPGGIERRGSPSSTTSSEPKRSSHRRTDSTTLDSSDDYFANMPPRLPGNQSTRSLPGTPRGMSRNISFSPRIQFHDVWSSTEYDRRGDIATCNRLTPMLAQQIKEELNTFKMEMEVHELSKPYTHFF